MEEKEKETRETTTQEEETTGVGLEYQTLGM
jgi:hypothetical protein